MPDSSRCAEIRDLRLMKVVMAVPAITGWQ